MMNRKIQATPSPRRLEQKILIIDDDPAIRETMSEMIAALKYRVDWAESGEEGLHMFQSALAGQDPFDLIITDMTFPDGLDGSQILNEIRRIEPEAKIIVSSGFSTPNDLSRYEQSGFNGFLMKPFGLKTLQQSILRVLEA